MTEKRIPDPECYLCDGEGRIYTSDSWWDCPICTDEDCLDAAKARIAELEAQLVPLSPKYNIGDGVIGFNVKWRIVSIVGWHPVFKWKYMLETIGREFIGKGTSYEVELQPLDNIAKEE